ncbi:hypothetical protein QTP88_002223 [Uroleucon formosanum]
MYKDVSNDIQFAALLLLLKKMVRVKNRLSYCKPMSANVKNSKLYCNVVPLDGIHPAVVAVISDREYFNTKIAKKLEILEVRPLIGSLITKHLSSNQTDCMFATMFKNTVSKDLAKRFSMESVSEKNTNEIPSIIRSKILSVNHISTTVCGNTKIAKKTILDKLMGQLSDDGEDEYTRYLSES